MAFCRHDGMQKHKTQYPNNASNTAHCRVSWLPWLHGWLGAAAHRHCPASQERMEPHNAGPGKAWNSKFEVWFLLNAYCFQTIIKSKNSKLHHCKSGLAIVWNQGLEEVWNSPCRKSIRKELPINISKYFGTHFLINCSSHFHLTSRRGQIL